MLKHSHPSYQHNIPDPRSMNIGKLGIGGALTSDTCNGAGKTLRLIVEQGYEAAEALRKDEYYYIRVLAVDFWNQLRNVWPGGTTKELYTLLGNTMREELDEINLRLRVLTSIKSVLHAVNKYFSLCDNYLKGAEISSVSVLIPITLDH